MAVIHAQTGRTTKCKVCRQPFVKRSISHKVCSPDCAITFSRQEKEKQERKQLRERKEKLKSRAEWMKEAQAAFNAFIRLRDANEPCISCGRWHTGQWHAGHYLSTGARPELRFDESNVHKQCAPCNNHLSGNIALYRMALIQKIGQAEVDRLEGPHEAKHYSIEDLRQIKAEYKAKAKKLGAN